jgi:hypothetical protein
MITLSPASEAKNDHKPKQQKRGMQGPRTTGGSRDAKKIAAAILEVLGGVRLPSDAATALNTSLPRYYLLESRALSGLIAACEPRPIGRVRSTESELAQEKKEADRLRRECARLQALLRAAQRTVGLTAPAVPKASDVKGKGRRKRKPTVRALKAAELLNSETAGETEAGSAGAQPAEG